MRRTAWTLGRAFSCSLVAAFLLPGPVYANDAVVAADFDGDGHGDHAMVTSEQPTVLRVWLSSTRTTELVRAAVPILRVAAVDLDGDHHAELIASDGSSYLRIWTKRAHRFRAYRPKHRPGPAGFGRTRDRASAARPGLPSPTSSTSRPIAGSQTGNGSLVSPSYDEWRQGPGASARASSALSFAIFAPRPPPPSRPE